MEFRKENSLISQASGFRNKNSCTTNLLESLNFATKVESQKDYLDTLLLDFEKAFEKVPHKILL